MKKNIGAVVGLYPTPVTVVGTVVDGRVNWINIVHVGIIGLDRIMISMGKTHYSNKGIKANKTCSINIVNKALIEAADYVGLYSGKTVDKSEVFPYYFSELENAPLIEAAPVAMACIVEDIYETMTHDNFIVRPIHTYVESDYLNEEGQIDFEKVSPILFEMGCKQYMTTGNTIGKGWLIGELFKKKMLNE
jgi:flavin reductase (DIM6/NTAB) family NADH-FMN oxidoreductase RutF